MRYRYAFVLVALAAGDALACRCAPQPLENFFLEAQWVGRATITGVGASVEGTNEREAYTATVEILESYKGGSIIEKLYTPASSAACGMTLQPEAEYWIFARREEGATTTWWVDSCSGTRPVGADFTDTSGADASIALALLRDRHRTEDAAETNMIGQRLSVATMTPADIDSELVAHFARHGLVSPNGVWRLVTLAPPPASRPPRVARLIVEREQPTLLVISLQGGIFQTVEWVNEKLVLATATLGGISLALLVDVHSGRIIYPTGTANQGTTGQGTLPPP